MRTVADVSGIEYYGIAVDVLRLESLFTAEIAAETLVIAEALIIGKTLIIRKALIAAETLIETLRVVCGRAAEALRVHVDRVRERIHTVAGSLRKRRLFRLEFRLKLDRKSVV